MDQCETLWEDIFAFAFPNDDANAFNSSDEYFLGPIVTFENEAGESEVIDGQQRLTTVLLLLRAFYNRLENLKEPVAGKMLDRITPCIWKTDVWR